MINFIQKEHHMCLGRKTCGIMLYKRNCNPLHSETRCCRNVYVDVILRNIKKIAIPPCLGSIVVFVLFPFSKESAKNRDTVFTKRQFSLENAWFHIAPKQRHRQEARGFLHKVQGVKEKGQNATTMKLDCSRKKTIFKLCYCFLPIV